MAEYVEREDAIRILRGRAVAKYPSSFTLGIFASADELKNMPAADVAPVVRCKDCRWWNRAGCAIRIVDDTDKPQANDFCSFGERRSE